MYNDSMTQRGSSGITRSNRAQEGQPAECNRGYALTQDPAMAFSVSSIHESDAHSSNAFSLGFMGGGGGGGGGGAYGQEYSGSLRHVSIRCIAERAYVIAHLCSQVPRNTIATDT